MCVESRSTARGSRLVLISHVHVQCLRQHPTMSLPPLELALASGYPHLTMLACLPPRVRTALKVVALQRLSALPLYAYQAPHLRSSRSAPPSHPTDGARAFSTTLPAQAIAEPPNSFLNQLQSSPMFKQLMDNPEALKALKDFAGLLQSQGKLQSSSFQYLY